MLLAGLAPDQVVAHVPAEPFPRRTDRTITTVTELLRELRRTAERGHAYDDNEGSVGLRCLAVPLVVDGEPIAALSVSGPSGEVPRDRHRTYLDQLRSTASALTGDADVLAALRMLHRSLLPPRGGTPSA
jgi:DNA-binding IclR family transcriptional regulator